MHRILLDISTYPMPIRIAPSYGASSKGIVLNSSGLVYTYVLEDRVDIE